MKSGNMANELRKLRTFWTCFAIGLIVADWSCVISACATHLTLFDFVMSFLYCIILVVGGAVLYWRGSVVWESLVESERQLHQTSVITNKEPLTVTMGWFRKFYHRFSVAMWAFAVWELVSAWRYLPQSWDVKSQPTAPCSYSISTILMSIVFQVVYNVMFGWALYQFWIPTSFFSDASDRSHVSSSLHSTSRSCYPSNYVVCGPAVHATGPQRVRGSAHVPPLPPDPSSLPHCIPSSPPDKELKVVTVSRGVDERASD